METATQVPDGGTSLAVLPFPEEAQLCSVTKDAVVPLAPLRLSKGFRALFFDAGRSLCVMDQEGKRFAAWKVLDAEPWLEPILPPATLPRHCQGHSFTFHQGRFYVGGSSSLHESLWLREAGSGWSSVGLPEGMGVKGKAIDGAFVHEGRLVCVDDIIQPKYGLVFDLADPSRPAFVSLTDLPWHTSYESVLDASMGGLGIALLSKGINHGTVSSHLSLLEPADLGLVESWSYGSSRFGIREEDGVEVEVEPALLKGRRICCAGRGIFVACGKRGLLEFVAGTGYHGRVEAGEPVATERVGRLASVDDVAVSSDGTAAFAIGTDDEWKPAWERLALRAR